MLKVLKKVFKDVDAWIEKENSRRREDGLAPFQKCEIKILGQMSLLNNEKVSAILGIQSAIASEKFPNLIDRIAANGGDLNFFAE